MLSLAKETVRYIPAWVLVVVSVTITVSTLVWGAAFGATLTAMAGVAFLQNMAFTAVSRSRNGGDTSYHRRCAWASNGVWLICQLFIWKHLWLAFSTGVFAQLVPLILVYVVSTTEGSVAMMERLIRSESGARRVGASKIKVKCLCIDQLLPSRATDGSAGFDLRADFEGDMMHIAPLERVILPTGVVAEIPPDHFGLVAIRSSLGTKGLRLLNSVGIIDSDYRGEIKVGVVNESDAPILIGPRDRIAQLIIVPTPAAEFVPGPVSFTSRGEGGFGSTGR